MNKLYYKVKLGIIIPLYFVLISCNKEVQYNPVIPTDASVVITVNPAGIKSNLLWGLLKNGEISNFEHLINSVYVLDSNVTGLFTNAHKAGISWDKPIYIFLKNQAPKTYAGISFFIADEEAFLNYYSSFKKNENNAYLALLSSNALIYYSDHTALYISTMKDSTILSTTDLDYILNNVEKPLLIDQPVSPVTFTIDGNYISSLTGISVLTDSSRFIGSLDFNGNLVKIEMDQQLANQKNFINHSFNPRSFSLEKPGVIEASVFLNPVPIFDQLSKSRKNILNDAGITKDLISEVFTGEVFLIIGNPVIVKEKYLTYELDDDFNTIEKWNVKERKQDNFIVAFSVKNQIALKKLLAIGAKKNLLVKDGNKFKISFTPTPIYLKITNSHLIISSNNSESFLSSQMISLPNRITVRPSLADTLYTNYLSDSTYAGFIHSIDSLSIQFEKPDPKVIKYNVNIKLAEYKAAQ